MTGPLPVERDAVIRDVVTCDGRTYERAVRRDHGDPPTGSGWEWIADQDITAFTTTRED